jgi:serine/threonine-protein kinase RsbT
MECRRDETFTLLTEQDVVHARQLARTWALAIGFSLVEQTKIVTAASELARNAIEYGGGGKLRMRWLVNSLRQGLRMDFVDAGPGIANVEQALKDGYSTGGGLGLGLSGARRLMSEFELDSKPGQGTRVSVTRWR